MKREKRKEENLQIKRRERRTNVLIRNKAGSVTLGAEFNLGNRFLLPLI
jgi:hypothetical protein